MSSLSSAAFVNRLRSLGLDPPRSKKGKGGGDSVHPSCQFVVVVRFLLGNPLSLFPPLSFPSILSLWINVDRRNRGRMETAHNTTHLDLPLSSFLLCLLSRSPPLVSPLPVRVRPPDLSNGREACSRCRRRILTTS